MTSYQTLHIESQRPFVYITLNQSHVHNAMNQQMILELSDVMHQLQDNRTIRAVLLAGADGIFCGEQDTKEMQAAYADPGNLEDEQITNYDTLLQSIMTAPQVVIAQVEGSAISGGLGLVCATDIAITTDDTLFAIPDVRLGVVPALIAPYVINRVGLSIARRLMVTGETFDGRNAERFGIVHECCQPDELADIMAATLSNIREAGPDALAAFKQMLGQIQNRPAIETASYRAQLLNDLRQSKQGQEGMLAFLRKRRPSWANPNK